MGGVLSRITSTVLGNGSAPSSSTAHSNANDPSRSSHPAVQTYRPHPPRSSTSTSFLPYFTSLPPRNLTHHHYLHSPTQIAETAHILSQDLGIPAELIPKILDFAEMRSGCITEIKKELGVGTGPGPGGRPPREVGWRNGQEEEVGWVDGEDHVGGLREGEGKVWYLCSSPIGCVEDEYREKEEGDDLLEGDEVKKRVWLREIRVETYSRDQGWSDNKKAYGRLK
jgi:hypothetical protein